jgi:hypothetical protein
LIAGCAGDECRDGRCGWVRDPSKPLPDRFASLGVHPDPDDLSVLGGGVVAYAPKWALWTNGSVKIRGLVLPEGAQVELDGDTFVFPEGAAFVKTFAYPADDADGLQPIETRVLRHVGDEWTYDVYRWTDDGRRAELLPLDEPLPVTVTTPDGMLTHTIPSRLDCRRCHESTPGNVLGFSALQLVPDGQVDALVAANVVAEAPIDPVVVSHPDPTTEAVIGYLHGNCTHCHNGSGLANGSFDMRFPITLDVLVDVQTMSSGSGSGLRIDSGSPDTSIAWLAMSGTGDSSIRLMPPAGVDVRDDATIATIRAWIVSLGDP